MEHPARMPFEFFQRFKNENERMVYVSPILSQHHWFSHLFIITNSTDIQNARDAITSIGDLDSVPLNTIANTLKPFSPIIILSTNDAPVGLDIPMGNGLAAFHLPKSINDIFYVYISYRRGVTSPYNTKVWCNILSFQNKEEDVFITFSEPGNELIINEHTSLSNIRELYNTKIQRISQGTYQVGRYGSYLTTRQQQVGFVNLKFSDILSNYKLIDITPPPQNIARPQFNERYTIPVTATLIGEYAKYNVITARDIVGKSQSWQLSKDQILDWIDLNKNNIDFVNALAISSIIADKYDYDFRNFVCVDYCAMFINIDTVSNDRRLGDKITLVLDDKHTHIWMKINILNKYRDANGNIREASYLWIDPTWFDNGNIYNFNNFTWGGEYIPQFMEGIAGNGQQSHKSPTTINWGREYNVIRGMTYSVVYINGRYICVQDDFGRRSNR